MTTTEAEPAFVVDPRIAKRVELYGVLDAPVAIHADHLNSVEGLRTGIGNRLWSMTDPKGKLFGFASAAEIESTRALHDALKGLEDQVTVQLQKAAKLHPLGSWIMSTPGVGLKQGGRLLGAVGNPYWNHYADRPRRGPAELWAYCGFHVHHLPTSDQRGRDTHTSFVAGGGTFCPPETKGDPTPSRLPSPVGNHSPLLATSDRSTSTLVSSLVGDSSPVADQRPFDAQGRAVGGGLYSLTGDHREHANHNGPVPGERPFHPGDQLSCDAQGGRGAGVAPRRTKGERANWDTEAKIRALLVAHKCVMTIGGLVEPKDGSPYERERSPYRDTFEVYKGRIADAVHLVECSQCGLCVSCGKPPGASKAEHAETGCLARRVAPAQSGSMLRDGHVHARAVRYVAKQVVKDLFRQARDWHRQDMGVNEPSMMVVAVAGTKR